MKMVLIKSAFNWDKCRKLHLNLDRYMYVADRGVGIVRALIDTSKEISTTNRDRLVRVNVYFSCD